MAELPPFQQRLATALTNPDIAEGLADFQNRWRTSRDQSITTLEQRSHASFDEHARQIAALKQRARQQPEILERFINNAQARGAKVIQAATAQQASQAIADICRRHQASTVVKTKSMATEEISLNQHLEAAGIAVVETDLGEWLLQCMHDRPSHLVVPAIHKRRHDIAQLLEQIYSQPFDPDDIETMARIIRAKLRPHFLQAGVGITGANVLVSETGSVVLVTNEGNAGLTTAMPPVHIVLAGWDKLVETVEDSLKVIQLLAKSATGQVLSSYTQFINGPIASGDNGPNAPDNATASQQELYIVLLDNGRSDMAGDPEFETALSCIRCGACSNVCPPYQVVGGHAFGHVYAGAIGLVATGFHHGWEAAAGPQSLCVSCGACAKACPANIDLPRQILAVRAKTYEQNPKRTNRWLRLGIRILRSPRLTAATLAAAKVLTWPLQRQGKLDRLPLPSKYRWRIPPTIPARPARRHPELRAVAVQQPQQQPSQQPQPSATSGQADNSTTSNPNSPPKTALFLQCISDRLAPSIPLASLRLLQACGAEVVMPTAQHCCGLPAIDLGDLPAARAMASATLDALEGYDCVVTPATSCAIAIQHDYPHLFADHPSQLQRAQELAERTIDLVSYLNEHLPANRLSQPAKTATAHPFCQNNHNPAFEQLLKKVCGDQLVALPEADVCCGFGGSTSLANPEISQAILNRKLNHTARTQAQTLVSDNPGCVLHLRGGATAQQAPYQVLHIAEFLAQLLPANPNRQTIP